MFDMVTTRWIDCMLQDIFYFILILSLATVTGQAVHGSCQGRSIFSNISGPENNTVKSITDSDFQSCDTLNQLIDLMEEVNILTAKTTSCYSLKMVARNIGIIDHVTKKRKISVSFHFEENLEDLAAVTQNSDNNQENIGNLKVVTKTSCQSSSSVKSIPTGRHFMSMQQHNGSGEDSNHDNSTVAAVVDSKGSGGLSHTQVVVIATCSAVIGTFFLVAAALRIRNYVKRKRQEQISRQSNCRTSGPGFQGSGHLISGSRRDSESSKASRQSSSTLKGGNLYYQVNSGMSSPTDSPPKHNSLDNKPLLVVTAPSTAANSPTDSNNSIQYIDEEQEKKKGDSDANGSSESQPLIQHKNQSVPPSSSDIQIEPGVPDTELPIKESPTTTDTDQLVDSDQLQSKSNMEGPQVLSENKVPSSLPLETQTIETPNMFSVNVGLTQSDDSINSHNASYQYGNQVEYSWDSGYGNYAYCPNEIEIEISDDDSQSPMELKLTEMTTLENSVEDDGVEVSPNENSTANHHDHSSFDILGDSFDIPLDSPNSVDETSKLLALQDLSLKGDNSLKENDQSTQRGCGNVLDDVAFNLEVTGRKNRLISQDSLV